MDILETALLEMCRKRKKIFFNAEDIIREMFPEDWEHFLPELESLIISFYKSGKIEIEDSPNENPVSIKMNRSLRIKCITKPKS
ncbi:hypothetical protein [Algoriphagus sp.]|uniref:hypothetical protein n=1 Tax=Algoriphagus sp. TaxID=1872435 RepID=UPI0025F03E45|nr:hypothetical protein [Algoriphagus sp.]